MLLEDWTKGLDSSCERALAQRTMPGWVYLPSYITPSLAHVKAAVTSKSTRDLPDLLLEKQCG